MICTLSYGCNYSQLINNYPSLPLELETADIKQDILALAAFFFVDHHVTIVGSNNS